MNCNNHKKCIKEVTKFTKDFFLKKNVKLTPLRLNILNIIWKSHKPIKAYDILDEIKTVNLGAKPPTVYRVLDLLIKNKLVHKIKSNNSYIGCYNLDKKNDCYFFICTKCNEIQEFCDKRIIDIIANFSKKNNFEKEFTTLEINGICSNCKKPNI